jgi:hypothetical protein
MAAAGKHSRLTYLSRTAAVRRLRSARELRSVDDTFVGLCLTSRDGNVGRAWLMAARSPDDDRSAYPARYPAGQIP